MPPSIDVVIPVHGNIALTDSCLRHLDARSVAARVIVYDDASADGTAQHLAAEWPDVRVVSGTSQVGFASAVNRGVAASDGDVIIVLNNDVVVDPGFVAALVDPLVRRPELGSSVPVMLQPGRERIDSVGLACDRTLAAFPRLHGEPAGTPIESSPHLTGPSGTAAAYRRVAWDALGGLDERITSYMEDFDLALRLAAAGWPTTVASDATGVHVGSQTYGHRSRHQRHHGAFARGYLLGRYRVLRGDAALRTLVTEAIVTVGDGVSHRDLASLRGRLAGLRAGVDLPRRRIPDAAIDDAIDFRRSLALRRGVYASAGRSGG